MKTKTSADGQKTKTKGTTEDGTKIKIKEKAATSTQGTNGKTGNQ